MKKYLPILRISPFFKGLTDNEILSILHCINAATISRKRDSYIFRAVDSTEVMGLVVSGCVLVIQEDLCLEAEGEQEYMKILAQAYGEEDRSEFYSFVRSLDALKTSMKGEDKTVILSADSPIAQIFEGK